jgi:hypothetical protein
MGNRNYRKPLPPPLRVGDMVRDGTGVRGVVLSVQAVEGRWEYRIAWLLPGHDAELDAALARHPAGKNR